MDEVARWLKARGFDFIRIDGGTMSKERQVRIEKFQNKGECRVALLSITSAGVAITLTAASTVYFAELFWTPASLLQAEDRAHRIGQTAEVNIYYFRSHGTVDDVLWPLLQYKIKTLGEVFEGVKFLDIEQQQNPTEQDPTEEDLKAIEALAAQLAEEETKCVADNDEDEEFEDPPSKKQKMDQIDGSMMSSSHSSSTLSSSPQTEQFNVDPLSLIPPLPPPPPPLDEKRMMRAARIRLLREQQRLSQALPSTSTGNHGQVICLLDDEVEESKAPSTTLSEPPNLFVISDQENDEPPEPAEEEEESRNAYEMLADCFSLSDFTAPCQSSEN